MPFLKIFLPFVADPFFSFSLQLVVLAAFVAYVSAQSGYAAPSYSAPSYSAGDYKPGYANGRVKMQVNYS